jgi:hypothetical protein
MSAAEILSSLSAIVCSVAFQALLRTLAACSAFASPTAVSRIGARKTVSSWKRRNYICFGVGAIDPQSEIIMHPCLVGW